MVGFRPAVAPEVAEVIRHLAPGVKRSIRSGIHAIGANPAAGEPLQGELHGLLKFRVGRFRIVYRIDRAKGIVRIVAGGRRRSIYEEVAELVRQRK